MSWFSNQTSWRIDTGIPPTLLDDCLKPEMDRQQRNLARQTQPLDAEEMEFIESLLTQLESELAGA